MSSLIHAFSLRARLRTSTKPSSRRTCSPLTTCTSTPRALRKRPGHEVLARTTFDGNPIPDALGLESYDEQLLLVSSDGLRTYTDAVGWVHRGEMSFTSLALRRLRPTDADADVAHICQQGRPRNLRYTDDRPAAHFTLADRRYGAYLAEDVALPEAWKQPRRVRAGDTWLLVTSMSDAFGFTLGFPPCRLRRPTP